MTIPSCNDKIAPVADDGNLKPPGISSAGDAEAERPGSKKERERVTGSAEMMGTSDWEKVRNEH